MDEAAGNIKEHCRYQGFFAQIAFRHLLFCFVFPPWFHARGNDPRDQVIYARGAIVEGGSTLQAEALLLYQRFLRPLFTDRLRTLYVAGRNGQECAQLQNGCALVCLDHIEIYHVARAMSGVSCSSQTRVHPAPSCALISKQHLCRCNQLSWGDPGLKCALQMQSD